MGWIPQLPHHPNNIVGLGAGASVASISGHFPFVSETYSTRASHHPVGKILLQEDGKYQECEESVALSGLPISLLEQTLEQLEGGNNGSAAFWFAQQIANLGNG